MRKNILTLSPTRARKFFFKQEIYLNLEIPPYYDFESVLSQVSKNFGWQSLSQKQLASAKNLYDVNHIIFGNKDGNYAWRKYELINPLLYVSLVNTLCDKDSWKIIRERFKTLNCGDSITCVSIPVLGDSNKKQKASQVNEWVDSFSTESLKLALDFEYLYQTDIVGCYSSIYTHSIAWALHGKDESKSKRHFAELLGNKIDHHIQAMCYGQTNGIPQGSVLMDFIAEVVLAYADQELYERISKRLKQDEYHILRYRDDYRIFTRTSKDGEYIMRELSQVLAHLGMSLNISKTKKSDKIILDSIKKDKLAIIKLPIANKLDHTLLRNELLIVYEIGTIYPNCGSIISRLMKISDRVETKLLQNSPEEIISILINIAFENPKAFPIIAALISRTLSASSLVAIETVFAKLLRKIQLLPNSGLMEIWLQRMVIKYGIKSFYNEPLCRNTNGENIEIFNNTWIDSAEVKEILKNAKYIDTVKIKTLDTVITRKEVELFPNNTY